jgi:hypothetical protein
VRLGEVVFHGRKLSSPHADVRAKKAVAVLFDERSTQLHGIEGISLADLGDAAYSGQYAALLSGHLLASPNSWLFPIRQEPAPGQYRYLQLAWKPKNPGQVSIEVFVQNTRVLTDEQKVDVGEQMEPGEEPADDLAADLLGDLQEDEGGAAEETKAEDGWHAHIIDLWEVFGRPLDVTLLQVRINGGGILIDRLRLARTRKDLERK